MGEVFRATDEQLGREVAVKLLLPSADEHANERFHREAQAAARLSDPHVVSVYDFGPHGDGFFLVMELVEGGTVATELARYGALPKDRAIRIVEQAAAGLAAAHREDVVHRDVKPGNLLLATDGTVKVADFGIAHLPADGANTLTATGQIIGSALYLAPERASGGPAGMPSDVYSLGCVLYQLVTGQPPFTGEHPAAILYQHVDAPAVLPSLERPELAGPFESVLMRMLAKDPADRPSAAEIAAGSLRAESPGAVPVVPPGVASAVGPAGGRAGAAAGAAAVPVGGEDTSALEPADAAPVSRAEASRAEADRARNKALAAGVVAMIATAAAVLAVVLLNGREPTLPPTTEIDPPTGVTSSPPNRGATTSAPSTDPTQPTEGRSDPTTSAPPSQTASSQPTTASTSPSPSSPSATSPSSTPTTPSSRPTQSSSTPSGPTSAPSSTASPPSSPPSSQSPGPTTPATGTPATVTPLTGGTPAVTGSPATTAAID
ncbi:protein kinase domain-containing protein [Kribbella sp. CA-294648]|uniref:serine/threonine-protein kinase n=1 Tax=Kribbella sp. CA-294648 TaxID=3239948 RepID=UPI003D8CF97B